MVDNDFTNDDLISDDLPQTGLNEPMSSNPYLMASLDEAEEAEFASAAAADDAVLDSIEATGTQDNYPSNVAVYDATEEAAADSPSDSSYGSDDSSDDNDYEDNSTDYDDDYQASDPREYTIDISPEDQDQLFREARTTYNWLKTPVNNELIEMAWDLAKFGPTAMNCSPLRIRVLRSDSAKDKLREAMGDGNKVKIGAAPVVLLLAASEHFHTQMAKLFPNMPGLSDMLKDNPDWRKKMAEDNAWLQAGYLLMALRAVGLSVGPMNGADMDQIEELFFANAGFKPFMVVNVGFAADPPTDYPRNPRLTFREVSETL